MPLPFIPILAGAVALIAGATGVKKGIDAYNDNDTANAIGSSAERKYRNAQTSLEKCRNKTNKLLEDLGKLKVEVFQNQIQHTVNMIKLSKKARGTLSNFMENAVAKLPEVEKVVQQTSGLAAGIATGGVAGGLAAFGATSAAAAYGTAATGTAIAGLHGAAATNATLAWLGGGSLASGGLGIAGGTAVLGGLVAGPLLAIGGFALASAAEKRLTNARKYRAEVDVAVEKMGAAETVLKGIQEAAQQHASVIVQAVERFESIRVNDASDAKACERMIDFGLKLKQILDVPVLLEDGTGNSDIKRQCSGYLQVV